jgi:hypothetical protein
MLDQGLKAKIPLAVLALLLGGPMTAHAADLYEGPAPYRTPPPYAGPYEPADEAVPDDERYAPPPVMRERLGADFGPCRVFQRVGVDPYGREVLRRVRVCDEPVAVRAPGWAAAAPPPPYGYGARFYGMPRPPRMIGPGPEFE